DHLAELLLLGHVLGLLQGVVLVVDEDLSCPVALLLHLPPVHIRGHVVGHSTCHAVDAPCRRSFVSAYPRTHVSARPTNRRGRLTGAAARSFYRYECIQIGRASCRERG